MDVASLAVNNYKQLQELMGNLITKIPLALKLFNGTVESQKKKVKISIFILDTSTQCCR